MTIQDIGLFQGLSAKMDYLNQRQGLIAQNIANADTPDYQAKDLVDTDFSSLLGKSASSERTRTSIPDVKVRTTDGQHLGMIGSGNTQFKARAKEGTYEVSPSDNSVIIEEQLVSASENMMDYSLMLNVYKKQVGMLKMAIGAS